MKIEEKAKSLYFHPLFIAKKILINSSTNSPRSEYNLGS